jgi:site-specific DNA recombinase
MNHAVTMSSATLKRCAVYTRKSTEEGLDQEFNSIDAQREAGMAFIESQRHEGWVAVSDRYDDAAFSGGNMERPGLKRLLKDIEAGKVDCIVTYKIDRLTRSLPDFAKMVEIFDQHKVSFVSVTQQFNTTTSMGRLTLNILLSFAQFERELTSERIRDKFLASRKKGMWMGGSEPLGYVVEDKKLKIHEKEAELVQFIFKRFTQTGSATLLAKELNKKGHTTKKRVLKSGKTQGGQPFNKGSLAKILHNVTYIGKVAHKGSVYDGMHEGIIEERQWDQVQSIFKQNDRGRSNNTKMNTSALLTGLLYTKDGHAMSPTHTRKKGKQYRYYTTAKAIKHGYGECDLRQIPAGEIEEIAINQIHEILKTPEVIMGTVKAADGNINEKEVVTAVNRLEPVWRQLFPTEQARVLSLLLVKVIVDVDGIDFYIRLNGLSSLATEVEDQIVEPAANDDDKTYHVHVPVTLKRRDGRKRVVVPDDEEFLPAQKPKPLTGLQKALIQAYRWQGWLDDGKYRSTAAIAKKEKIDPSYVQRILKYALLAPDLVESILHDQVADGLAARNLSGNIPVVWEEQQLFLKLV